MQKNEGETKPENVEIEPMGAENTGNLIGKWEKSEDILTWKSKSPREVMRVIFGER